MKRESKPPLVGQIAAYFIGCVLLAGLALLVVRSAQTLLLQETADEALLVGFEIFLSLLFAGTLGLVIFGLCLRLLMPGMYGKEAIGAYQLHEFYDREGLGHISIESDEEHEVNPYQNLPDLELCDVAETVDREKSPLAWNRVSHEIKTRVELKEPLRIG